MINVEMGNEGTGKPTNADSWPLDVRVEHAKDRMYLQNHLGTLDSPDDGEVASFGWSGPSLVIHCQRPHRSQYVIPLSDVIRDVVMRHERGELSPTDDYAKEES